MSCQVLLWLRSCSEPCLHGLAQHLVLVRRALEELGQELLGAARHGDAEEVRRLLAEGAPVAAREQAYEEV